MGYCLSLCDPSFIIQSVMNRAWVLTISGIVAAQNSKTFSIQLHMSTLNDFTLACLLSR